MEESYIIKLERIAKSIAKFQDLAPEEREWLQPLLGFGIQNTLKMLELIAESNSMTFEEIALELDIHPGTASQKIHALIAGGYPLEVKDGAVISRTGRPRRLARIIDNK